MFNHGLRTKVLAGIQLDQTDNIFHLQYADDLIIFSTCGQEDLYIIKLILYLFEGSSGLSINFLKSCLYFTDYGFQLNVTSVMTLNCTKSCLPIIYLGIPLSRGWLRRQDWTKLIGMFRSRLSSWKSIYLSLGCRLTLIQSLLSTILVYWTSVFKLPSWVIKK